MCLIVDTCCLAQLFDPGNGEHSNFLPVLNWVVSGRGRIIYGGSKYNKELRAAYKFLGIMTELERKGRAIRMPEAQVNKLAISIKRQVPDRKFNDEHLVALVIASRCGVVCTNDRDAISYLKRPEFYRPHRLKKPKIYRSKHNHSLCSDRHLIGICLR